MTVAYLFGSLNRGGTETLMLDVFRSVQAHQFTLLGIYRKEGALLSDFQASGKEMIPLRLRSNPVKYLSDLRSLVKQHKIEILHAVQSLDAVLADFACTGLNVKVVQTIHSFDFKASLFSKVLIGLSLRLTDANVFVSHYQRDYYSRMYPQSSGTKNRVVYNGIAMDKLIQRDKQEPSNPLKLLTVGNFNAGRDQLTLCRFALRLKKEGVNFRWLFAGKRIENEAWRYDRCMNFILENDLSDCVSFPGVRNDVPQLLAQSDLFVYASEYDTFGIAVVEAMAAGIPVLVNDWPVMKEITEEGKWAAIYKTKDEDDFFYQFKHAAFNEEASAVIRQRYSIQAHISSLLEKVYTPLLQ